MRKQLKHYLDLEYPVEIRKIPEEEGGGYSASIPQLGKYAFVGDGETVEEALASLNEIKSYLFEKYLEQGIPIPEPEKEEEREYSGKFLLRVPKELHRFLALEAKQNSTTLNQYCLYLLTRKSFLKSIQDDLSEVKENIQDVFSRIKNIDYKIEHAKSTYDFPTKKLWLSDYKKSA